MGDLSIVQWIFIGLGTLVAIPVLFDFVSDFGLNFKSKQDIPNNGLSRTVRQWESLYASCQAAELNKACDMLKEVFPLLIKKDESKTGLKKET